MQNYQKLLKKYSTREKWALAMCKELSTLSQVYKGPVEGTNNIFFMSHDKICDILPYKTVTYAQIVVDYRPQKSNRNRVRITVGGNILNVPGYPSTTTSDLITSKILWNSVLSKQYVRFACINIKNIYLQNPMTDYEYMQTTRHLRPQELIDEYGLDSKIYKGFSYCDIRKGIYGFPQAGKLANTLLKQYLATCG